MRRTRGDAEEARFLGSPTIRIDGADIEIGADRGDHYSVSCRVYREAGKVSGIPSKELIRQALHRAATDKDEVLPGCC